MPLKMVNVKLDPKMYKALKALAEQEFTSVSSLVKKGIDLLLRQHGIKWREDPLEKKPKK
jgi:Arc/MetJ-type ribon-helix-helix transcriptional regulator